MIVITAEVDASKRDEMCTPRIAHNHGARLCIMNKKSFLVLVKQQGVVKKMSKTIVERIDEEYRSFKRKDVLRHSEDFRPGFGPIQMYCSSIGDNELQDIEKALEHIRNETQLRLKKYRAAAIETVVMDEKTVPGRIPEDDLNLYIETRTSENGFQKVAELTEKLGKEELAKEMWEKALDFYTQGDTGIMSKRQKNLQIARCLHKLEREEESQQIYDAMISKKKAHIDSATSASPITMSDEYNWLAVLQEESGRKEDAVESYTKTAKSYVTGRTGYSNRKVRHFLEKASNIAVELGKPQKAVDAYVQTARAAIKDAKPMPPDYILAGAGSLTREQVKASQILCWGARKAKELGIEYRAQKLEEEAQKIRSGMISISDKL